ncbi:hypothetical protein BDW62DRAFT_179154 [Aspergillus aurantiobrunneus]
MFLWGFWPGYTFWAGRIFMRYKDLERRERYTSCIGSDLLNLFRKVCDSFYLAYVLCDTSTLFSDSVSCIWLGTGDNAVPCFRSTACESLDWINVQYTVSHG